MLYVCYWNYGKPQTDLVPYAFFMDTEQGYAEEDRFEIFQLTVGQSANLSDPSGTHIVTRVE